MDAAVPGSGLPLQEMAFPGSRSSARPSRGHLTAQPLDRRRGRRLPQEGQVFSRATPWPLICLRVGDVTEGSRPPGISSCNRHSSPFLPFSAALVRASVRFPAVRRQKETLRRGPPRPGRVPTAVCCSHTMTPAPPAKAQALEKAGDEAKATGLSRCLVRVQISPVRDDAGLTPITMPRSLNQ